MRPGLHRPGVLIFRNPGGSPSVDHEMQDPTKRRKVTIYVLPALIEEIARAADLHDRSASWIVRRAWKIARAEISRLPVRKRPPDDGTGNAA